MRARMGVVAAPLLALVLAACGDGAPSTTEEPGANPTTGARPAPEERLAVAVAESELGPILVDQSGRTLYAFTKDEDRASNCDTACVAVWPALTSAANVVAGQGVDAALLGRTEPAEGQAQATYGQWPLYYYVGDAVAGDVNGHDIDGEWFALSPNGKLVAQR